LLKEIAQPDALKVATLRNLRLQVRVHTIARYRDAAGCLTDGTLSSRPGG
jgi:hypothetical protein